MVVEGADHALYRGADQALPGGLVLVDIELLDLGDDLLEELVSARLGAAAGPAELHLFETGLEAADPLLLLLQQLLHIRTLRDGRALEEPVVELLFEFHEPVEQVGAPPAGGRLVAKSPQGVLDPAIIVVARFGQGEGRLLADGGVA